MTGSRATLLIVAFALAGGIGGLLIGRQMALPPERALPPGVASHAVGSLLPPLSLPDIADVPQPLHDGQRPLLVNFWATWCAPCVEEMPLLDAFARSQPADGVRVVGVALDGSDEVVEFLGRVPVDYPILVAGPPRSGDVSEQLGNSRGVLPFSVLVGADRRILATRMGDFSAAELEEWVAEHL